MGWIDECCLAGSSKTAPRIFIFSNVLGAEYLFYYMKSIATYALTLFGYIISVLASVLGPWRPLCILQNEIITLLPNSIWVGQKKVVFSLERILIKKWIANVGMYFIDWVFFSFAFSDPFGCPNNWYLFFDAVKILLGLQMSVK